MRFVFGMWRRELRASWRKLIFFFLCIGVGVAGVVALRSLVSNLNRAIAGEARSLLTADVQLDSTREWNAETLQAIKRTVDASPAYAQTETVEMPTMIRPADDANDTALMIELKAVEDKFPLVGTVELEHGQTFSHNLLENNGAVVAPLALERLHVKVGDKVKIGTEDFQVRGVIAREPGGGGGGFRLGPRVFIDRASIERTGLTGFGSRARRKILLRTGADDAPQVVKNLRGEIKNNLVSIRSYKDAQENLSQQFSRTENYLSLAGLTVLVLGGIGISNTTRTFIEQQRKSIAVLKCLGSTNRQVTSIYLLQAFGLGVAGSLCGVALAGATLFVVGERFRAVLPPQMNYGLSFAAVWQGCALGLLVSLLFSASSLLRVRRIKPNLLLRDAVSMATGTDRRFDRTSLLTGAFVAVALVLIAMWQANSWLVGIFFIGGLAVTSIALYLAASLLIAALRFAAARAGTFPLRHAIGNLRRPGNQTRVTIVAIGLGVFLIVAVQALQSSLVNELDFSRRGNLPDMFLIDIQPNQTEGVAKLIRDATGTQPTLVPTVRTRIVAVNGREIDMDAGEVRQDRGRLGREYVVTYRPNLETNEMIVGGTFWSANQASGATPNGAANGAMSEPEVSIEEGMRGLAGMELGSLVTFDVLGRRLAARVTSIRKVDWRNTRTGFMVLFKPGALERAPQTFISAINAPMTDRERARFLRQLVDAYPNISAIDVTEIVSTVRRVLDQIIVAVAFIGGFVILSGVLILAGSISLTKPQRIYESAILRACGAEQKTLLQIAIVEYTLVGLVAGLVAVVAGALVSYAVARFVLEIEWSVPVALYPFSVAVTIALVAVTGIISGIGVLRSKPMQTLRAG